MGRLAGKRILITGAGGGIGQACSKRFLAEGASIAAADMDIGKARCAVLDAPSDRSVAIECDVSDAACLKEAISATVTHFGGLDVLCCFAGGSSPRDGRVTEAPEEEFWRVMGIDLYGTFLACKYAVPHIARAGGGSIITMTSMTALMALADRACYSAAKGGVVALTRAMAAGHACDSIRVNAIAPGITLSERVKANLVTHQASQGLAERHLLGLVEVDDIAHLAVYLAADESKRVTGQVFPVDSGVTIT